MHVTSSLLQLIICQQTVTLDMQLAAREAAAEKIWDAGVLGPANSLINFHTYNQEVGDQAGSSARWQARVTQRRHTQNW